MTEFERVVAEAKVMVEVLEVGKMVGGLSIGTSWSLSSAGT